MEVRGWLVAKTKPQREMYVAEQLSRQGYQFYLPRILVFRPDRVITQPLFPSYIFPFIGDDGRWLAVLSTYGISKLIMNGPNPVTINQRDINLLKSREDENGFIQLVEKPTVGLSEGDKIRFKEGLYSGHLGIYDGMAPQKRVRVLMEYLGRKTKVLVAENSIELAS